MNKTKLSTIIVAGLISGLSLTAFAGDKPESFEQGKKLYSVNCVACHQPTGQGIPGAFPPLAGSDYLADRTQVINVPLKGLSGPITVNGQNFNSAMPAFSHLSDADIAAVLTYVTNEWGNEAAEFTADEIKALR
jgi:mono/diheme cytochrome c family protein